MTKMEFEQLRDLSGKRITQDIRFASSPEVSPNLVFDHIRVDNSLNYDVLLNGTFKPGIPSVTFNFVIRGTGPICLICVNGTIHGSVGRTHKHALTDASDSRLNLPTAIARPDLENKLPREVWQILCDQVLIEHTGTFFDPTQYCYG